jgi:hypothetical protein
MARKKKRPSEPRPQPPSAAPRRELNRKHKATLTALFTKPARSDIALQDFVSLMNALGATVRTAGGSAHSFTFKGVVGVFHRPHPGNELYRELIKRIQKFLSRAGVRPQ